MIFGVIEKRNPASILLILRSLLFILGQAIITLVYFPFTLLAFFLPARQKAKLIGGWGWIVLKWLRLCCGTDYRIRGRENLPASPFVVLLNHQSAWETISLLYLLPANCWVLKKELLKIPVFGWGLALALPIAIDRGQPKAALRQLLTQGPERLRQGLAVVICPEGTRMPPGRPGQFNPGGSMLAVQAQVPLVPIAHNSGSFWINKGVVRYPGTIDLVIGEPIDTRNRSARDVNLQARDWIVATLEELESAPASQVARTHK